MEPTNSDKPLALTEWSLGDRRSIRYVFADIDDTMTTEGKLEASTFTALWRLKEAGIGVVPVTGRPAGWCDAIVRQWPVEGVVGENGALSFWESSGRVERLYHPDATVAATKGLTQIRDEVLQRVPDARVAGDQFARLFDLAIDFAEEEPKLPLEVAETIKRVFVEHGATAKVSSIHVNGWFGSWDKQSMVRVFGEERLGLDWASLKDCSVYLGDSPNDEPLFESFDVSIGVANVVEFLSQMKSPPLYLTRSPGGAGFTEAVSFLLDALEETTE